MNNRKNISHVASVVCAVLAASFFAIVSTQGFAKEAAKEPKEPKAKSAHPAHPRKDEVMNRDRHLAKEANRDYGDLSGHYNQIQRQDAAIRKQTRADMAANGGHLTKGEQKQLNREENGVNKEMAADKGPPPKTQFEEQHPRRAEVLHRDNRIGGTLNADAGKLGGNYGSLKQQQQSIRQQEQADAAANGGHITKTEQNQLNSEENQLNQEIKADRTAK